MPIIAQAAKKLRRDVKRSRINEGVRLSLRRTVKLARKKSTAKNVSAAFAALDKAVKRGLIHANRSARTKSRLAKLLAKK